MNYISYIPQHTEQVIAKSPFLTYPITLHSVQTMDPVLLQTLQLFILLGIII
jgi:hypothetical protein